MNSRGNTQRTGEPQVKRDKLWTPLFVMLIVMSLCTFIVSQGLNSGTSVYLSVSGLGTELAGVSAALFSIGAAVMRLFCGPLLDQRGRFITLAIGFAILIVATFVPTLKLGLAALVVCRACQGIGFSLATTAAATMAADVLPFSRLGEGIGFFGLGQAIAMSVGPAFALFLLGTDSPENLYGTLAIMATAALVIGIFSRYENKIERLPEQSTYRLRAEERRAGKTEAPKQKEPFLHRIFVKSALAGAIPAFLMAPLMGFSLYFCSLFGTTYGIENAGLYYTLSAVTMIVVRIFSNRFMDALPPKVTMGIGCAAGTVTLILLFIVSQTPSPEAASGLFYVAGLIFGAYNGLLLPLTQSVAVKCTHPDRWGAANALSQLALDIGIGCACVLWGFTNAAFGFPVTIVACIASPVLAFVAALICFPKK